MRNLCLHGVNYADETTEKLIRNLFGKMYVYNSSTGNWDYESVLLNTSTGIDSDNFLDHAFFVNGVDANRTRNSSGTWSTTTNVSDSPIAKYIKADKTRVYLGNIKINSTWYRSRVWYSDFPKNGTIRWGLETGTNLAQTASSAVVTSSGATFITNNIKVGDPFIIETGTNAGQYTVRTVDSETQITLTGTLTNAQTNCTFWVGGNWFDVNTDDGDVIKGFGKNSNEVVILKRTSAHRYNPTAGTLRQVKEYPGTSDNRSIVDLNEYTYYYDPASDSIRRYDGVNSITISNAIEDILQNMTSAMKNSGVVGWSVDGKIVEFYIGNTSTREGDSITKCVASWSTTTESWSLRSMPYGVEQSTKWTQSGRPETYIVTDDDRVLKVGDGYTYAGTPMSFELLDQPFFPEGHDKLVDFDKLRVFIDNGHDIQVMYRLFYIPRDDGSSWYIGEWESLKGRADSQLVEFDFSNEEIRRACGVQFKFIQSSSDESFTIEKYILYASNPSIR